MDKIALLYAPAKGRTEKVAKMICEKIGNEKFDLILINEQTEPDLLKNYKKIIFGISTVGRDSWDAKYTKIGWDLFLPKLYEYDFSKKTVAIFGLGDHLLYANNFVDAMGALGKVVEKNGANLVGKCSQEGYTFSESEALVDDTFLGLPIDEDNEEELTDERLTNWLKTISADFGF
ncbi:MAG: flavodoxin [Chloroflexia bacterium]|nr:flavodoxin [Chloroflexia bacterium]